MHHLTVSVQLFIHVYMYELNEARVFGQTLERKLLSDVHVNSNVLLASHLMNA